MMNELKDEEVKTICYFMMEALNDIGKNIKYVYRPKGEFKDYELWVSLSDEVAKEYYDFLKDHHRVNEKNDILFLKMDKNDNFDLIEGKPDVFSFLGRTSESIREDPFINFLLEKYKKKNNNVFACSIDSTKCSIEKGDYILWGYLEKNKGEKKYCELKYCGEKVGDDNLRIDWMNFYKVVLENKKNLPTCEKNKILINDSLKSKIKCGTEIEFIIYVVCQ